MVSVGWLGCGRIAKHLSVARVFVGRASWGAVCDSNRARPYAIAPAFFGPAIQDLKTFLALKEYGVIPTLPPREILSPCGGVHAGKR
jgi:predicted dehydrogenase